MVPEIVSPDHKAAARRTFTIVNQSATISDADARIMHSAVALTLPTVAEVWGQELPKLQYADGDSPSPTSAGDKLFCIVDQCLPSADAPPGCSYICAQTVLQNGGASLWAKTKPTVVSVLFREIVRALMDPDCNSWWKSPDGTFHATDIVGPVQGQILGIFLNHGNPAHVDTPHLATTYNSVVRRPYTFVPVEGTCSGCPNTGPIMVNGSPLISVGLSDFLYPAWCDPEARQGARFSYTGSGNLRPFQASETGYDVTVRDGGEPTVIYGKSVPEWLRKSPDHEAYLRARGVSPQEPASQN